MQLVKSKNGRVDDTSSKNDKSIRPFDKLYRPSDREPFMNERQREYFRLKLLDWRPCQKRFFGSAFIPFPLTEYKALPLPRRPTPTDR